MLKKAINYEKGDAIKKIKSVEYGRIHTLKQNFSIVLLCEIAGFSRSEYYKWEKRINGPSEKMKEDQSIIFKIVEYERGSEINGNYGYRRSCIWMSQNVATNSLNRCLEASVEGLNQRFNKATVQFLQHILTKLLNEKSTSSIWIFSPYTLVFNRIRILDSTVFQLRDIFSSIYPGREDVATQKDIQELSKILIHLFKFLQQNERKSHRYDKKQSLVY